MSIKYGVALAAFCLAASSAQAQSFEAEAMAVVHSGTGSSLQTDANTSGGQWISLDAENTGSWMEFTTPTVAAGTYTVKMRYKGHSNRGQLTLRVDGTQVGTTLDQYASPSTYPERTFGTVTFGSAATHKLRLTVTGKNSASSGYVLSADRFTFDGGSPTPPTPTPTPAPPGSTPTPSPTPTARPTSGSPTDGWTRYSATYGVQNWTEAPLSQRFWFENGIHRTRVYQGESRVEMRWKNWPSQSRDNMWDGDVMFSAGTLKTCIMQIKSNTGGEPIYIQVTTSGTIRNDGESATLATGLAGQWFNLKASFNPSTGVSRAYLNDVLVKTRQYNTSARDWYFKNGTYNNGRPAGYSEASFRNIRHWSR